MWRELRRCDVHRRATAQSTSRPVAANESTVAMLRKARREHAINFGTPCNHEQRRAQAEHWRCALGYRLVGRNNLQLMLELRVRGTPVAFYEQRIQHLQ